MDDNGDQNKSFEMSFLHFTHNSNDNDCKITPNDISTWLEETNLMPPLDSDERKSWTATKLTSFRLLFNICCVQFLRSLCHIRGSWLNVSVPTAVCCLRRTQCQCAFSYQQRCKKCRHNEDLANELWHSSLSLRSNALGAKASRTRRSEKVTYNDTQQCDPTRIDDKMENLFIFDRYRMQIGLRRLSKRIPNYHTMYTSMGVCVRYMVFRQVYTENIYYVNAGVSHKYTHSIRKKWARRKKWKNISNWHRAPFIFVS